MRTAFALLLLLAACSDTASVPLASDSPWPKFRADARQTGRANVKPTPGGALWTFKTGKGIFSTPVIGGDGTIYVGSADRVFYALNPHGGVKWTAMAGEVIDSSALLDDKGRVYFGAGDGHLRAFDAATGTPIWDFVADPPGGPANPRAIINWFEGNVTIGTDGTLYAGNDNFFFYGINRDTGKVSWRAQMADQTWSAAAVEPTTGQIFVGNNALLPVLGSNLLSLKPDGEDAWRAHAWTGTTAASPLLTQNGLLVAGGFDGFVRGVRAKNGEVVWTFGTRDHVYASAGELPDGTIIQPSADGTIYALDPTTGTQKWAFDTLEPIRSSPAIDADGNIYVGSGEGRLFVLNRDGSLRWSIKLIDDDRNDLNSSPALGRTAIYIAGESGEIFSVPYDYCLTATDARCSTGGEDLPAQGAVLRFTTGLGALLSTPPAAIDPNQPIVLSLFVREAGDTRLALIDSPSVRVDVVPPNAATVEVSGDRRFVAITPSSRFESASGSIRVRVSGDYLVDPAREGLLFTGGQKGGSFEQQFEFALRAPTPDAIRLQVPTAPGLPATAFEMYRLAAPLPTMLPSYNQIGFDSLHFLLGIVEPGVAWVVGGKPADSGATVADPTTRAVFALDVDYRDGLLTLDNSAGFSLEAMGATLTFNRFRIATRLDASGKTITAPQLGVSTICSDIQLYGPFIAMLGLCNPQTDRLLVSGGVLLRPHAIQPLAVEARITRESGAIVARLAGTPIRAADHAIGILLVDAVTNKAVSMNYGLVTTQTTRADGSLDTVSLRLSGREPARLRAYVMVDTYPVARATLSQ